MNKHSTELKTIMINGKPLDVYVTVYCDHSDLSLDDIIGDAEDRPSLERKINRGDLMLADIMVKVSALGFTGSDSLGGCYIEKPEDVAMYVTDHDMVNVAISDFKVQLSDAYKTLTALFNKAGA
jgi:hypothetical protein